MVHVAEDEAFGQVMHMGLEKGGEYGLALHIFGFDSADGPKDLFVAADRRKMAVLHYERLRVHGVFFHCDHVSVVINFLHIAS